MERTFIVGGNYKMNGDKKLIDELIKLLRCGPLLEGNEIVVAPPYPYLEYVVSRKPKQVEVAAQNIYKTGKGAYTGEVSADMLIDIGVKWVILGHSERRTIFKESDEYVVEKVLYALEKGLKVIYCIGESLAEREAGQTEEVVFRQVQALASKLNSADWKNIVIAYEPIWAIGTGKTATPKEAQDVHDALRKYIIENISEDVGNNIRIQYGGSVTAATASELARQKDIDGFLVGGASIKPEFIQIVNSNGKPAPTA